MSTQIIKASFQDNGGLTRPHENKQSFAGPAKNFLKVGDTCIDYALFLRSAESHKSGEEAKKKAERYISRAMHFYALGARMTGEAATECFERLCEMKREQRASRPRRIPLVGRHQKGPRHLRWL